MNDWMLHWPEGIYPPRNEVGGDQRVALLRYRSLYGSELELGEREYPCHGCGGKGWYYDPNDSPCPVEGNKLRDRIKCAKCKHTGKVPEKVGRPVFLKWYHDGRAKYKSQMRAWREHRKNVRAAFRRLTKPQRLAFMQHVRVGGFDTDGNLRRIAK